MFEHQISVVSNKTDKDLMFLIHKWQSSPKNYINLLIDEVYSDLYAMCQKQINIDVKLDKDVSATASSLVNEVFIKMKSCTLESEIDSVQTFYRHSRNIIRSILLDRYRRKNAIKRNLNKKGHGLTFSLSEYSTKSIDTNIEEFVEGMEKLKKIEPAAHEAISIRFYNAKTDVQIANIMGSSVSSVERSILNGRKILNALVSGVDISAR